MAMRNKSKQSQTRNYRNEPTYWFAILEIARERADYAQAAAALAELRRLGVSVSYKRQKRSEGAPANA
jgi:hypothetical protein